MGTINDLIRKLERFQQEIKDLNEKTVTIIPDNKGMIDRQCPKDECNSFFKVNAGDWRNIVKDEEAFCPFCRHASEAKNFFPSEQRMEIIQNIKRSISNFWKHNHSIVNNIIPLKSSEEFELDIECEKCHVRFSVIGAAYFCPCCGFNSIERTATNSIEKLILKAEKIFLIQTALEQSLSKDESIIISKSIIENSLSDCIGTLQTFSEEKYKNLAGKNPPFNAFQNVEKSNKLWQELKGEGYEVWLTAKENQELILYTQRRHLLEHKGGIIDLKYLQITNDSNYKVGDKIIVIPNDITVLGKIILKIIDSINKF
jgi:hypothetical protein